MPNTILNVFTGDIAVKKTMSPALMKVVFEGTWQIVSNKWT